MSRLIWTIVAVFLVGCLDTVEVVEVSGGYENEVIITEAVICEDGETEEPSIIDNYYIYYHNLSYQPDRFEAYFVTDQYMISKDVTYYDEGFELYSTGCGDGYWIIRY